MKKLQRVKAPIVGAAIMGLRSAVALMCISFLLPACTENVDQSGYLYYGAANSAWPRFGSRVLIGGNWVPMTNSGIKYIICTAEPSPVRDAPGGGDLDFTGTQVTALEAAFEAFDDAKIDNGSYLPFTRIYTNAYGTDPFVVPVRRMSESSMEGAWGAVISRGFGTMDYNGDGIQDGVRQKDAIIEIRSDVTPTTAVMAHEIGHTMGLNDCAMCNNTTVMSYGNVATAPSACDNAKIAGIM